MSLEEALNKNTAAVEKHNTLLEKMLAAGGKATTASAPEKPAASGKPAAAAGNKTTTNKGKAAPTLEALTAKITAFLKTGTAEVRAERKEQAAQIIEYYGVERFTAIAAENWPEALAALDTFEAGDVPAFLMVDNDGSGDDGDGGDDGAMI